MGRKVRREPRKRPAPASKSPYFRRGQSLVNSQISQERQAKRQLRETIARNNTVGKIKHIAKNGIVITFSVILLISVSSRLFITGANASNATGGNDSKIASRALEVMNQNPWERFKPFSNVQRVERVLREEFTSIKITDVKIGFISNKLQVSAKNREPLYQWNKDMYIDEEGYIFPAQVGDNSPVNIQDNSGIEVEEGDHVLPQSAVEFISSIIFELDKNNIEITEVSIPESIREIHFKPRKGEYVIKTTTERGVEEQIEDFNTAYKYIVKKGIKPTRYIDIRVPDKVYYQ